ncbi:uncharacterized protein HD556DRAFT_441304 [Suillus plorans]|uniref:C2H2-type domain-containing protein n=1 Tax=Suillus plorans TaxID=116603 RepID=A0A9P7ARW9_9AGAM|nr:uncharacterized protein HD556DRAFT_441304 [Suillus plorans]KAG1794148.1 hypothetical protein HD556DRAFT_441304 [Suillus plorans]
MNSEADNDALLHFMEEVRALWGRAIFSVKCFLQDEGLALFLYEKFVHNKETPIEAVSEAVLLQALEEYFAIPPTEASSGIEDRPESSQDGPTEIGVPDDMQKCGWMDEATHKECPELVPAGRQSMLSHLNKAHNVRGPEKTEIKCMWGVLQSGYKIPCGEKFQRRTAPRHMTKHLGFRWQCEQCEKSFARSDLLRSHERDKHEVQDIG